MSRISAEINELDRVHALEYRVFVHPTTDRKVTARQRPSMRRIFHDLTREIHDFHWKSVKTIAFLSDFGRISRIFRSSVRIL